MATIKLKVSRIGNSRGIRLPAATLHRYQVGDSLYMEEHADGILLRPDLDAPRKLSWDETARAMAAAGEDWSDWDSTLNDGLSAHPWTAHPVRRVAESKSTYASRQGKSKSSK